MTEPITSHEESAPELVREPRVFDALKYWAVIIFAAVGTLLAWTSHDLLPEKFFLDESIILRFVTGELRADGFSSYGTTGLLYRVTGLGSIPELFPVISYLLFVFAIFRAVTWRGIGKMSPLGVLITSGSLLLGAAYLSQYSKEFFVIPLVILLLSAHRSLGREIVWILLALAYAFAVRPYWFLVVALYVAFRFIVPRVRSTWVLLLAVALGFIAMIVAFQIFLGEPLTFFRTDINNSLDFDRSTQIDDFIPGESIPVQWVNALLVMASMTLPFPLLLSGAGLQTLAGAFMAVCWILFFRRVPQILKHGGSSGVVPLAFLASFLMVQTAFEPDYGSYIRHICPMLPLLLSVHVRSGARGEEEHEDRSRDGDAGSGGVHGSLDAGEPAERAGL